MTRLLDAARFPLAILILGLLASASSAFAQQPMFPRRGFIDVNGGYQMTSNDFESRATFNVNAEEARFTTNYEVRSGPTLDVAGGATVWRRVALGVGVTRFSRSTAGTLDGSVPHPLSFDRPRSVTGDVTGLKRDEFAVHVQTRAVVPIGSRLQLMAFGGPSYFRVTQAMVSAFTWTDSYPFDAASFTGATTATGKGASLGFNGGLDLAFFFSRQFGVGSTVQFAAATVRIESSASTQEVKAGGGKAGAGLRVRF